MPTKAEGKLSWLDLVELHVMDWDRAKRVAADDVHRLLGEVERLRNVLVACEGAPDLQRIQSLIRADRKAHKY